MLHEATARNRRVGIGLLTLATMAFATLDTAGKWLVLALPVFQVVWLRFVAHVLISTALMAPIYRRELFTLHDWRWQLMRGAMLCVMTAINFWALQYLQLAEVGAIQFSVPLLIALLSAWWLKERLSARRWLAIVTGFLGVLLIMRPGTQGFHPALLLSLLNALLYAIFNLLTRRMAATESPAAMQWYSALTAALLIAPFGLAHWQWPQGLLPWLVVGVAGFCGAMGHYLVAKAHRYASSATIAPFMYQQILYMTAWGWLVFAQVPGPLVVAGAVVVVLSGLYLLWLELKAR